VPSTQIDASVALSKRRKRSSRIPKAHRARAHSPRWPAEAHGKACLAHIDWSEAYIPRKRRSGAPTVALHCASKAHGQAIYAPHLRNKAYHTAALAPSVSNHASVFASSAPDTRADAPRWRTRAHRAALRSLRFASSAPCFCGDAPISPYHALLRASDAQI
jgi:hypothetical protein